MKIRVAQKTDLNPIQRVIEAAFSQNESKVISKFTAELLSEVSTPLIKSLVAELEDEVVGFVSFSPIFLNSPANINGYILAPLAVSPKNQKKGIGSKLIKKGIHLLSKDKVDILLVYGDPNYYGRFGFKKQTARPFIPPFPLTYDSGWQGVTLSNREVKNTSIPFSCVNALNNPDLW